MSLEIIGALIAACALKTQGELCLLPGNRGKLPYVLRNDRQPDLPRRHRDPLRHGHGRDAVRPALHGLVRLGCLHVDVRESPQELLHRCRRRTLLHRLHLGQLSVTAGETRMIFS
jgi:hypothetical protein